jgi:hypothetical protein
MHAMGVDCFMGNGPLGPDGTAPGQDLDGAMFWSKKIEAQAKDEDIEDRIDAQANIGQVFNAKTREAAAW